MAGSQLAAKFQEEVGEKDTWELQQAQKWWILKTFSSPNLNKYLREVFSHFPDSFFRFSVVYHSFFKPDNVIMYLDVYSPP